VDAIPGAITHDNQTEGPVLPFLGTNVSGDSRIKKNRSLVIDSVSVSRPSWWRAKLFRKLNLIKEKENDKFEQQTGSCSEDAGQCRAGCHSVGDPFQAY
jgi:hypothetical protein